MPTATGFNPENKYDYKKTKLNAAGKGLRTVCTAGATTNIDYSNGTDDILLIGMKIGLKNHVDQDKMHLEIHHPINGLLIRFYEDWQVFEEVQVQEDAEAIFPAKIPAGLILRIVYVSTGETDVVAKVNLKLAKVLV